MRVMATLMEQIAMTFVGTSDDMDHSAIRGGWAQPWDTTSRQLLAAVTEPQ